jgi:hypothetical protein
MMLAAQDEGHPLHCIARIPGKSFLDTELVFAARNGDDRFVLLIPKMFTTDTDVLRRVRDMVRKKERTAKQAGNRPRKVEGVKPGPTPADYMAKMAKGMDWGKKNLKEIFMSGKGAVELLPETVEGFRPYTAPWFSAIAKLHNGECCECKKKKSRIVTLIRGNTWLHCHFHGQAARDVADKITDAARQQKIRLHVEVLQADPMMILKATDGVGSMLPLRDRLQNRPGQSALWVDLSNLKRNGLDPLTGESISYAKGFLIKIDPYMTGKEAIASARYLPLAAFTARLIDENEIELPEGMYLVHASELVRFVQDHFSSEVFQRREYQPRMPDMSTYGFSDGDADMGKKKRKKRGKKRMSKKQYAEQQASASKPKEKKPNGGKPSKAERKRLFNEKNKG